MRNTADNDRARVIEQACEAIAAVRDPELGIALGQLGMVRGVELAGTTITARIALTIAGCPMKDRIAQDISAALSGLPGIHGVEVRFDAMDADQRGALVSKLGRGGPGNRFFTDGRTSVIAIASGKGGVGKSTIAVNLACAIAASGKRVGLIDVDMWGFSVPRMLGIESAPAGLDGILFPAQAHGVKVMSVGLFAEHQAPVIWRGPLLHKAMQQFLGEVHWGELDVLLCDLPPGTGDVPISIAAMLPGASVVMVTTPQEAASTVAERAGRMAERARLRIAGVVENMSEFVCPCCGETTSIFGRGGGESLARELRAPLLARIPLAPSVIAAGDAGTPAIVADPDGPASVALQAAAVKLMKLSARPVKLPIVKPGRAPVKVESDGMLTHEAVHAA